MIDRKISRREFIKLTGTAAGLTFAGSWLSACVPVAPAPQAGAPAAAVTAKSWEGATVSSVFISGENDETALRERVGEVKDQLGITVEVADLGGGAMHDKLANDFRAGTASYDLTAIVGFWLTEFVGAGFLEPLQPYLDNKDLTSPDFDFADFIDPHLDYISYYNIEEQRHGRPGDLYLIPGPHSDACWITCRTDLLEKAGVEPPKTWEEYLQVAEAIHDPDNGIYGTAVSGKTDPTIFLVDFHNRLVSLGGKLFEGTKKEKNIKPLLTSPEALAALTNVVEAVKFSPPGTSSYTITETSDAMASGKVGMIVMWAITSGRFWEPSLSKISDKVVAVPMPGQGEFAGISTRGGWGMGIPKAAKNKEAAWKVIEWYSTKELDKYRVMQYGVAPVRKSTLRDPEVVEKYPWAPLLEELLGKAVPIATIDFPDSWEFINKAAAHFNAAVVGSETVEEALDKANAEWIDILKRGGWAA